MGYKKVSYKSKEEGKVRRCTECLKNFPPKDDEDVCPRCAKKIVVRMLEEDAQRALEGPRQIIVGVV